jgi:hypothetical protein
MPFLEFDVLLFSTLHNNEQQLQSANPHNDTVSFVLAPTTTRNTETNKTFYKNYNGQLRHSDMQVIIHCRKGLFQTMLNTISYFDLDGRQVRGSKGLDTTGLSIP